MIGIQQKNIKDGSKRFLNLVYSIFLSYKLKISVLPQPTDLGMFRYSA